MMWAQAKTTGTFHMLSTVLSLMLVLMLVSPGIAAFASETSATPEPVAPVEAPQEVAVSEPTKSDDSELTAPEAVVEVAEETTDASVDEPATEPTVSESLETQSVTVAAVASLAAAAAGGGPRSDFPAPITVGEGCELVTIATFWAGQHTDAGSVSVTNDADNVYVTFTTTGGWTMGVTHLYVGTTAPSTYAPGQFPLQTTHNPQVTSYTYTISLASLNAAAGDTLYVAAHAEVHNGQQSETAWAGQGQWPGLLFSHIVQECDDPEPLPADITVVKFNDLNENGELDEGEPYLEGVEITIESTESTDSALTNGNGMAVFGGLYAGAYAINEVLPDGWFATVDLPIDVELVEDEDQTVYIGNAEEPDPEPLPADITVVKFNDLNENGELDEGEPYLEGVEITIESTESTDSALTNGNGMVVFGGLYAGAYAINEVLPDGWFATVDLPIDVELVEDEDQTVYIGNAEEQLPFTLIDLAIEKEADVETASAGDLITYTLTYRNVGETAASDYTIIDDFDERYVAVVDSAGGTVLNGTIVWNLAGPLAPEDGDMTISYTVRVIDVMPEGSTDIDNVVVIGHPQDENPDNNVDTDTVVVDEPFLPFTPQPEPEPEPTPAKEPFLPFTGGESTLLMLAAALAAIGGLALRKAAQER